MKFGLVHDSIAQLVSEKVSTDSKIRRQVEAYLSNKLEIYQNGADKSKFLLSQDDFDYINPHLKSIDQSADLQSFIDRSRSALRRAVVRKRNIVIGIISVLTILLAVVFALWLDTLEKEKIASANALFNEGRLIATDDPTAGLKKIEEAQIANFDKTYLETLYKLKRENLTYDFVYDFDRIVNRVIFSSDGDRMVVVFQDIPQVFIFEWDGQNYLLADSLKSGHDIYDVAASENLNFVLAGGADRKARLWDRTGGAHWILDSKRDAMEKEHVKAVAFSNSEHAVFSAEEFLIQKWKSKDTSLLAQVKTNSAVQCMETFSGEQVLAGLKGGDIVLWPHADSLKVIAQSDGAVMALTTTRDRSRWMAVSKKGSEQKILFFDRQGDSLALRDSLVALTFSVQSTAFSPDGKLFLIGGEDGLIHLFESPTLKKLSTLKGHVEPIVSVSFSEDRSQLFTASRASVRQWDLPYPLPWKVLEYPGERIVSIAFSKDGNRFLAGARKGNSILKNFPDGGAESTLAGGERLTGVDFSSEYGAIGFRSGLVQIWPTKEASTPEVKYAFRHDGEVKDIAFSPSGQQLLSASIDSTARVFQLENADSTILIGHRDQVLSVAWAPDGKTVLTGGLDSLAILWNVATGKEIANFKHQEYEIRSLVFLADGQTFLSATDAGKLYRWDVHSETSTMLAPENETLNRLLVSPQAAFYITTTSDGIIRKRDLEYGFLLREWHHPEGYRLTDAALSADGRYLLTCGRSEQVFLWKLD